MPDLSDQFAAIVHEAHREREPLRIMGGNSKAFYGRETVGKPLFVSDHTGVVDYKPTELVVTARGGTLLSELDTLLAAHGQLLPFEPPYFGPQATLGGTVACGLSGPRRPYTGAVRDFVLGVRILNGRGEQLRFGGQVMKNVAGYDISRLMAGSLGTLGVLLEISIKVLPQPEAETTVVLEQGPRDAIDTMNALAGRPLPLSGAFHHERTLCLRLSGTERAVSAAQQRIGGSVLQTSDVWRAVREQAHAFFAGPQPLWRLSVAPATPPLDRPEACFIDWGGGQRWLYSEADTETMRSLAAKNGGHATLFRSPGQRSDVFHPLPPGLLTLHQRLKSTFDPHHILNPGRMYAEL